ncbi:MAG: 30S ribosomal protein S18 [Brevinema sp.]
MDSRESRPPKREEGRDTRPTNNRNFRPNNAGGGKKKSFFAKKVCKFTTNQIDPATIDYKNIELLKRFVMPSGKIVPRRITGTSSKYQRILAKEIKKARIIGLLPFSAR